MTEALKIENEIWKDIPGFSGIYQASTLGRIRTAPGKTTSNSKCKQRVWQSRILKPKGNKTTGYQVTLWLNGWSKTFLVARLVCATFKGESSLTVNHIDGNRFNNNIDNLEWLSLADNIKHGFENNLYPQKGCILTDENFNQYKFNSMSKASEFLGRSTGYISQLIKSKRAYAKDINGTVYSVEVQK